MRSMVPRAENSARSARCAHSTMPRRSTPAIALGSPMPISMASSSSIARVHIRIREVGPRDGFQNEPEIVPTDAKVRLIERLARTGLRRLEVTSFVRPDVIPQLADGAEVLERIRVPGDVSLSVLIPNERGLENALRSR